MVAKPWHMPLVSTVSTIFTESPDSTKALDSWVHQTTLSPLLVWITVNTCAMETSCPQDYKPNKTQWISSVTQRPAATQRTTWASLLWPSKKATHCVYIEQKTEFTVNINNTNMYIFCQQLRSADHVDSRHGKDSVQAARCPAPWKHLLLHRHQGGTCE